MKRLNLIAASLVCAFEMLGVPADPEPKVVAQPDGSLLTVRISGDEHRNILLTSDGFPLILNQETGFFEYAEITSEAIRRSGVRANEVEMREKAEMDFINNIDRNALRQFLQSKADTPRQHRSPKVSEFLMSDFPTTGSPESLVILVQFSDVKFSSMSNPIQFYTDMLNQEGFTHKNGANGSAVDFYKKSSCGKFVPNFVVAGPYTLEHEAKYYGEDNTVTDARMGEFLTEACALAHNDIDFSKFDLNGDGMVDNIFFFYAGSGQADDPKGTDYIWPHAGTAYDSYHADIRYDGVQVGHYACTNEIRYSSLGEKMPSGIGTFVHEFGHVLGLTDHYDVTYNQFGFGIGTWDTMANGSYNNNMHTPPEFSGFERAELGWIEYTDLDPHQGEHLKFENLADNNKAYRISVEGQENEFYVLENRQQTGWDEYLPGHGLLVWHIDQDKDAFCNNRVNTDPAHQRIDIVEADGKLNNSTRDGDSFPGADKVTEYSFIGWNGLQVFGFDDVTETDGEVYVLLTGTDYAMTPPSGVRLVETDESTMTLEWTPVDHAKYYLVTITESNSGNVVGNFSSKRYRTADPIKVTGLAPETEYVVAVQAGLGSYVSEAVYARVATTDIPFSKLKCSQLAIDDINEESFTATWDYIKGAEGYDVFVYGLGQSSTLYTDGYDFGDKANGMPLMWNSNSSVYYAVKGYYGEASPSLRFSYTGDYLECAYPDSKMQKLTFWTRAKYAGQKLTVEGRDEEGIWNEAAEIEVSTTGETISINLPGFEAVKLTCQREEGFVVVDDIELEFTQLERIPIEGLSPLSVGNVTSVRVPLSAEGDFCFKVRGVRGDELSALSEECKFTKSGNSRIEMNTSEDPENAVVYDLLGRRMQSCEHMEKGIYIVNGKKVIIK